MTAAWVGAWTNLHRGLALTRQQPDLYVKLVILYSLPPIAAAFVVLLAPADTVWPWHLAAALLPAITMVVAPVVLMHAVDAAHDGERIGVLEATRRGMPKVPRYVWTNVHTTVLFWTPIGLLLLLHDRSFLGQYLPTAVWIVLFGGVALHQHVRTVLAPYLAVHGDMGGTRAALASWDLGGRYFWLLLGTFLLGTLPIVVPIAIVVLLAEHFGPSALGAALLAAGWQLGWVGVQSTRPLLIPAIHTAYEDIWARRVS